MVRDTSVAVGSAYPWKHSLGRTCAALLTALLAVATAGCPEPTANILVDSNGNAIRMDQITLITSDTTTTTAEKRQALSDLGITDEQLIDLLLK
ncbi:MAG TPA: hypothetical protein PKY77_17455 [Phycisphaerae bacterium]|nr:hypothetical protein [Phycisphaerae bacterium]HRY68806.1 hypothetical protein [Phycisphaerae bacterium]HSA27469.1 hypothetical protein [Phycisphaerae bacterium]